MHLIVLACDLDGTLADSGEVAADTWAVLRQAKTAGLALLLVTGRILQSFTPDGPYAELFDAIVAEDGAVVYFPRRDIVMLPFGHLSTSLIERLEALSIPLERGMAIVATRAPHDVAVLDVLRASGGGATVEYNRGAVMVLPAGATKGTGLLYALRELGYSPHNVVACGDAENDRSLFDVAEVAVAVANAAPDIQALADVVLSEAGGAGVRTLIADLLAGQIPARRARPERRLCLGRRLDGTPVYLDPFMLVDDNLGIVGSSGAGKSWLAGLLAEELLKQGYQICLIDPEGDYRGLRAFPHTLLLGGADTRLPTVEDVVTLSEYAAVSLVLDFSSHPLAERRTYINQLLQQLRCLRARHGRPHWILVDEVQSLCPANQETTSNALLALMHSGGVATVSYRPSQVAPSVLAAVDHWLLTRLDGADESTALTPFLKRFGSWPSLQPRLSALPLGQAQLYVCPCRSSSAEPELPAQDTIAFRSGSRAVPHIRHLHKYLRAALPPARRFYFYDGAGHFIGRVAASLWEFHQTLGTLPIDSLRYHLTRGDFERWIRDVVRDSNLAQRLNKLAHRELGDAELRGAIVALVGNRYQELDSLV